VSDQSIAVLFKFSGIVAVTVIFAMPAGVIASDASGMSDLVAEARSLSLLADRLNGKQTGRKLVSPKIKLLRKPLLTYGDIIHRAAKIYRVPANLIAAVIKCESNWQSAAHSQKGARGLMQIMPKTAEAEFRVDPDQLWDPTVNIHVGTAYLRVLTNRYAGNSAATVSAYNAGPGRLESGKPIPAETRRYSNCVRRWFKAYRKRHK
jgi:soluble lytic murein transglycosylase-like protein